MITASGKMYFPLASLVLNYASDTPANHYGGNTARNGRKCGRSGQIVQPFRASCQKATK
jgi:hypothetical protein